MVKYVLVKVNDYVLKWPSWHYIDKAFEFNISCQIEEKTLENTFKKVSINNINKYYLKLSGKEEDIETFISYLKLKGFKTK